MTLLAGFIPPPRADDTPIEAVQIYTDHLDRVRAGLVLMMVSSAFFAPWGAVTALQVKRIEGRFSPMAWTVIACTGANLVAIAFPEMIMLAASFRPERDPEITQALNDLGWLPFIMYFAPVLAQCLAIGTAVVSGNRPDVFPRWVGYFNLWIAVAFLTPVLMPFFKTGPFAWHGFFEFWVAAFVFFIWMIVMTVAVLGAIKRQAEASRPSGAWRNRLQPREETRASTPSRISWSPSSKRCSKSSPTISPASARVVANSSSGSSRSRCSLTTCAVVRLRSSALRWVKPVA